MRYLIVLLFLAGCTVSREDINKNQIKYRVRKVKVEGMDCVVVSDHSDGSGWTGITCNWEEKK